MIENLIILILSVLSMLFLLVSVALSRSLDKLRKKLPSEDLPEGYVDFVERSRGVAFDYIEETQQRVGHFLKEVQPLIDKVNTKTTRKDLAHIVSKVDEHLQDLEQVLPSTK